ncbi:MAG: ornithine carbamoyltransferase [Chloroflexi bacterium]|nr:ornithine carbamoyltransferase [Chloroflexota bacterium]|tara:strand:- start:1983 stop:2909 length:927 start_codon:yes stop_codon:yes gene_type:complete
MKKDFINLDNVNKKDLEQILNLGKSSKKNYLENIDKKLNSTNKTGVLLFEKPSLRTKLSFFKALNYLGINPIYFDPKEVGMGGREKISDIAKVLSKMSDLVILRTFKQDTIEEFSLNSDVPVINALSDEEHPCQAIGDIISISEKCEPSINEIKLTFIGDGNNVATSLAKVFSILGGTFIHSCPKGFEIPDKHLDKINDFNKLSKGNFILERDPEIASKNSDVIYTDVWTSMGQESEKEDRKEKFKGYQVNASLLENSKAIFMHDLPAHHGEEISEGLVDHNKSIVFDQAENRIWGQVGLIRYLMNLK